GRIAIRASSETAAARRSLAAFQLRLIGPRRKLAQRLVARALAALTPLDEAALADASPLAVALDLRALLGLDPFGLPLHRLVGEAVDDRRFEIGAGLLDQPVAQLL